MTQLEQAQESLRSGDKRRAARLLAEIVHREPANPQAWFLLAFALEAPQQQRDCLERVLKLDPDHAPARAALARLDPARDATKPAPSQPRPSLNPSRDATKPAPTQPPALQRGVSTPAPPQPGTPVPPGTHVPPFTIPIDEARAPTGTRMIDAASLDGPAYAVTSKLGIQQPPNPMVEALVAQARAAEVGQEYAAAHQYYTQALEIDSSHAVAWLGRGSAAAMRSNAEFNGFAEFFDCLTRAVLAHDRLGLTLPEALPRADPETARAAADRLLRLSRFAASLVATSGAPMNTVYAVERARLADLAFTALRALENASPERDTGGLHMTRGELVEIAEEAVEHIIDSVTASYEAPRTRREQFSALRALLLGHLSSSGLAADAGFLRVIDERIAEAVLR